MVETINPVVHGGARIGWIGNVALHVLGATLAAAAFGAALGTAGMILGAPWGAGGAWLVAGVGLAYAAAEASGAPLPVPQARRQVPEWWRTFFSRPVFSFLYGAGLGVGFATYVSRGTLVGVAAFALACGRPLVGLVAMAPFGLARSAVVLIAMPVRTQGESTALVERLADRSTAWGWRAANVAASLAIAAAAIVALRTSRTGLSGAPQAVLAVAFGWAAIAKFARRRSWRDALSAHDLPPWLHRLALGGIPAAEAAVAVLALLRLTTPAAIAALFLLATFSVAVVRSRLRSGRSIACGCFGRTRARDWRLALGRNAILAALAAASLLQAPLEPPAWRPPRGDEILPALLAVGAVIVAVWVVRRTAVSRRAERGA
jgi:methylamine utilization protein MauE